MTACLTIGAAMLMLPGGEFTLDWEHSVEHVRWREAWVVEDGALRLTEAAVQGSGAGMEPGPDARLTDGWWVWSPTLPPQPALHLAASGATAGGWRLCSDAGACQEIGAEPGAILVVAPCAANNGNN